MIHEQFSLPASHLAGTEESGEAAVVGPHRDAGEAAARARELGPRPPYFAYTAALNAMDQPDDPDGQRHVD
jgi:hypothetical protein